MSDFRKKFKISPVKIRFHFLKNPFPRDEMEYYDSQYYQWISRIEKGQERDHEIVAKITKDLDDEQAELYAEDYFKAIEISGVMYAALTVAMWSNIESFMKHLIRICETSGYDKFEGGNHQINNISDYFKKNLNIKLLDLKNNEIANTLRVLSNSFKHNNGRYEPDSFPIAESIKLNFDIEERRPIKYEQLPFQDLIKGGYNFCADFKAKVKDCIKE
ncbi:hypothetical protein [Desulfobacula sp.]|uniref:hypothetical protein n=1 Tax=Desulfobacula sp. TaxID=2593537 RepID=UPI001EBE1937|nr:hypothetical protein [Desulfobacula sp.]